MWSWRTLWHGTHHSRTAQVNHDYAAHEEHRGSWKLLSGRRPSWRDRLLSERYWWRRQCSDFVLALNALLRLRKLDCFPSVTAWLADDFLCLCTVEFQVVLSRPRLDMWQVIGACNVIDRWNNQCVSSANFSILLVSCMGRDEYVCVSVCLSARISSEPHAIFTNFCACCVWPWLGPSPASLRYVIYFRFYGWRFSSTMGRIAVWSSLRRPISLKFTYLPQHRT